MDDATLAYLGFPAYAPTDNRVLPREYRGLDGMFLGNSSRHSIKSGGYMGGVPMDFSGGASKLAALKGLGMTDTGRTVCGATAGAFNTAGALAPLWQSETQYDTRVTNGTKESYVVQEGNNAQQWGQVLNAVGQVVGQFCQNADGTTQVQYASGETEVRQQPVIVQSSVPAEKDNTLLYVAIGVGLIAILALGGR